MRIDFQWPFLSAPFPTLIERSRARMHTVPPEFLYPQEPFAPCPSSQWRKPGRLLHHRVQGERRAITDGIGIVSASRGPPLGFLCRHSMGTLQFLGANLPSSPLGWHPVRGHLLSSAQQAAFCGSFWESIMAAIGNALWHTSCTMLWSGSSLNNGFFVRGENMNVSVHTRYGIHVEAQGLL